MAGEDDEGRVPGPATSSAEMSELGGGVWRSGLSPFGPSPFSF